MHVIAHNDLHVEQEWRPAQCGLVGIKELSLSLSRVCVCGEMLSFTHTISGNKFNSSLSTLVYSSLVSSVLDWSVLVCSGLVWSGLAWSNLVWSGLA